MSCSGVTRLRVYGTERALDAVDKAVFIEELRCKGAMGVCSVLVVVGRANGYSLWDASKSNSRYWNRSNQHLSRDGVTGIIDASRCGVIIKNQSRGLTSTRCTIFVFNTLSIKTFPLKTKQENRCIWLIILHQRALFGSGTGSGHDE